MKVWWTVIIPKPSQIRKQWHGRVKYCLLKFRLIGIRGKSFFRKEFRIGQGDFDTSDYIHALTGNSPSVEETVTLDPSPIQLVIVGTMSNPIKGVIILRLQRAGFKSVVTCPSEREAISKLLPKVPEAPETCNMATHTYVPCIALEQNLSYYLTVHEVWGLPETKDSWHAVSNPGSPCIYF